MTAKAARAQAASDARLTELLAKCGPVWVPAEDQEHLRAVAAKDAFYAREAAALAYCGRPSLDYATPVARLLTVYGPIERTAP